MDLSLRYLSNYLFSEDMGEIKFYPLGKLGPHSSVDKKIRLRYEVIMLFICALGIFSFLCGVFILDNFFTTSITVLNLVTLFSVCLPWILVKIYKLKLKKNDNLKHEKDATDFLQDYKGLILTLCFLNIGIIYVFGVNIILLINFFITIFIMPLLFFYFSLKFKKIQQS